jgi:hypothetical protein
LKGGSNQTILVRMRSIQATALRRRNYVGFLGQRRSTPRCTRRVDRLFAHDLFAHDLFAYDLFAHDEVARIPLRPRALHRRRHACVVRSDVCGSHLERIPALFEARIGGQGLSPARVDLRHQNEQHGFHSITLTSCSSLRRAQAIEGGSPLRFCPCAAATRCRAGYEKDPSKLSMPPKDRYRYVAYSTPSSKHPERMILRQCWCDLHFVATPSLQNPAARRMPKSVMSSASLLGGVIAPD